jgi:hypothetical protein
MLIGVDAMSPPSDDDAVRWILSCVIPLSLIFLPVVTCAQSATTTLAAPSRPTPLDPGDPLRVYLITFGPGSDPWEKFGHDCIAIEDTDAGTSLAYNWGVFDFGQGMSGAIHFGWHFLQGKLLYSMQSDPTAPLLDAYAAAGRSILVQELNLTASQKRDLKARLEAMDTEANRYYLYDYFKKNCTTMARDQIDQCIDGRIARTLKTIPTQTTFRWQDRRLSAEQWWLYFFLDYSLGQPVDHPLSAWQESFLPEKLALHLQSVQVPDALPFGEMVPLILWQKQLAKGVFNDPEKPPGYFLRFLAIGMGGGGVLALLAFVGTRLRFFRWVFNLLVMGWSLFAGAFGALSTFAWFTNHDAAKWNENWFLGNPLSLLLIVLAPMAWRWPTAARRVAFVVAGLSAFDLVMKITPWFFQVNGQLIAAALPIHAAIAWGIYQLTTPSSPPPRP